MKNQTLRLSLILLLVAAITAGILGVINYFTAPIIAQRNLESTMESYAAVLPADSYEDVEYTGDDPTITKICKAADGSGWVFETSFSGAQGMISMVIGVSSEYKCTGISIISHSETSGLGAVAAEQSEKGEASAISSLEWMKRQPCRKRWRYCSDFRRNDYIERDYDGS